MHLGQSCAAELLQKDDLKTKLWYLVNFIVGVEVMCKVLQAPKDQPIEFNSILSHSGKTSLLEEAMEKNKALFNTFQRGISGSSEKLSSYSTLTTPPSKSDLSSLNLPS